MHCSCEREALVRVLTIGADLCRAFPDVFQVTFVARAAGETSLEVLVWQETSGVGVWATVPADIREAGSVTVPTRATASALATMPGSRISLASVQIPDREMVAPNDLIKLLLGGPALQLESISTTGRTQRTRLLLRPSLAAQTMEAAVADGGPHRVFLASLGARALRATWEPCLLLARKRDQAMDDTPDMDHALVLFRFDPDALVCTATTRYSVAQTRLPWMRLAADLPASHVLVDERRLGWISKALKGETQPVALTLVPQADSSALLLVVLSQVTLVCRVTTAPIPLVWERRVHAPVSQVMLVSRVLLARSLDVLAADRAHGADRNLLLQVQGRQLRLQWDPLAQEDQVVCELPLVNAVEARAPVLVHLRSLREMVRQFKEPVVCLEQGNIRVRKRVEASAEPVPIGFVRLSQPVEKTIQILMSIAERVPSSSKANVPVGPASETSEADADAKGEALATISSCPDPFHHVRAYPSEDRAG
jgi:hypothetical protein